MLILDVGILIHFNIKHKHKVQCTCIIPPFLNKKYYTITYLLSVKYAVMWIEKII